MAALGPLYSGDIFNLGFLEVVVRAIMWPVRRLAWEAVSLGCNFVIW